MPAPLRLLQKADVWSCGVMLFVLLAGRYPFARAEDEALLPRMQLQATLRVGGRAKLLAGGVEWGGVGWGCSSCMCGARRGCTCGAGRSRGPGKVCEGVCLYARNGRRCRLTCSCRLARSFLGTRKNCIPPACTAPRAAHTQHGLPVSREHPAVGGGQGPHSPDAGHW